ncbi:MAG TPA: hypothetical protein VEA99_16805 [Gemmatimonadaceae bacterium]|nr:hypothetical protein [Gemmatimonadaceae bacterium]
MHRSFTDPTGRDWIVWRVVPLAADRRQQQRRAEHEGLDGEREGIEPRSGMDRRHDPARADEPDRRSGLERRQEPERRGELDRRTGADRRVAPRARVTLPGGYSAGWLCFESEGEKRRLTPVPDQWECAGDAALGDWLERAVCAHPRRVSDARTSDPRSAQS